MWPSNYAYASTLFEGIVLARVPPQKSATPTEIKSISPNFQKRLLEITI